LENEKELLFPADTDQGDLVPSKGTDVDFAAQSAVQQCTPLHNEPAALVPQKDFAPSKCFDVIVRSDIPIELGEM